MLHVFLDAEESVCNDHKRASWLDFGKVQKLLHAFVKMEAGRRRLQAHGGFLSTDLILSASMPCSENFDSSWCSSNACKAYKALSFKSIHWLAPVPPAPSESSDSSSLLSFDRSCLIMNDSVEKESWLIVLIDHDWYNLSWVSPLDCLRIQGPQNYLHTAICWQAAAHRRQHHSAAGPPYSDTGFEMSMALAKVENHVSMRRKCKACKHQLWSAMTTAK